MALIVILGLCSFVGLFVIILFMLPRSSAQSALLDQVTRKYATKQEGGAMAWHSAVECRCGWPSLSPSFVVYFPLSPTPIWSGDCCWPDIASQPMLIFSWERDWPCPALLGFLVAILVESNTIFFFLLPWFWLSSSRIFG